MSDLPGYLVIDDRQSGATFQTWPLYIQVHFWSPADLNEADAVADA